MNLQIVTMDAPYFTLRTSALARELFGKVLGVRLNAYLQDYGEGVFPLGKEDFLSELVIVCERTKNELNPVYSFKTTMLGTCDKYKIPFPMTAMLSGQPEFEIIARFVEEKRRANTRLAYFGSRSKSVEHAWNKESAGLLYHVGVSALVNCCDAFGIEEFILFAMLNNKAYKYCDMLGMQRVIETPAIVESLASSGGYIMHKTKFSGEALDIAAKFKFYWNERIHIKVDPQELSKIA